ncbi:hypothetical protein MMC21_004599 [Puttea exsequens]|nr:hypothetical protein [Puttea exsequens]
MPNLACIVVSCVLGLATRSHAHRESSQHFVSVPDQQVQLTEADIDNSPLLSLHRDLVNIDSTSGTEGHLGDYLTHFLQSHNYTVEKQHLPPLSTSNSPTHPAKPDHDRFNILAYPGTARQTPILLTTHLDTVPPFYNYTLHPPSNIHGRGTVDAKACIATQFFALDSLLRSSTASPNSISLLLVSGEEVGGDGMLAANALNLTWETVVFGEPTDGKLATGHKGILIFTLTAHGKAGHSGYPWLGKSAVHMLLPALAALQALELPASEKYGNSTLNIGQVEGGVAANVIAERASAKIGIRLAGGEPEGLKRLVRETVRAVDADIVVNFHGGAYGPVPLDSDIEGFDTITVNYGTDVPNLDGKHKRYLYGPGSILVAHSDHEHLSVEQLEEAVEGYKRILRAVLGRREGKGDLQMCTFSYPQH